MKAVGKKQADKEMVSMFDGPNRVDEANVFNQIAKIKIEKADL